MRTCYRISRYATQLSTKGIRAIQSCQTAWWKGALEELLIP
jgi:hypothetical protein